MYIYIYTQKRSFPTSFFTMHLLHDASSLLLVFFTISLLYSLRRALLARAPHIGLYNIHFYLEVFVHESIIFLPSPHTYICHTIAILLHDYCAIYDLPLDPPCVCYSPYNIGNDIKANPHSIVSLQETNCSVLSVLSVSLTSCGLYQ